MTPYYEHNGITIYHGDAMELRDHLPPVGLLVSDPPYGMKENTKRASSGRGKNPTSKNMRFVSARDWSKVHGDDVPFDPAWLLGYPKVALFGAQHYANKLPPKPALDKPWKWFVWDKREGTASDDNSDCDFIWSNLTGAARVYRQLWRGICRRGEENIACGTGLLHPTQKPVALMQWLIKQLKPNDNDLVADPYMGSGSTLLAAKRLGLRAIGIEIEEKYCEIAANRMSQEVLSFEARVEK